MEIIVTAKEKQADQANKNAAILLDEIDAERTREESKKERQARKRERKRQKKKEKLGKDKEPLACGESALLDKQDLDPGEELIQTTTTATTTVAAEQSPDSDKKEVKKTRDSTPVVDLPGVCQSFTVECSCNVRIHSTRV